MRSELTTLQKSGVLRVGLLPEGIEHSELARLVELGFARRDSRGNWYPEKLEACDPCGHSVPGDHLAHMHGTEDFLACCTCYKEKCETCETSKILKAS